MRNWILIIISWFLFQGNSSAQKVDDEFLALLEKGRLAFENKDYNNCIICYEKAAIVQPQNAWLKYAVARCYDFNKKNRKAQKKITQAIQFDWEGVEGWLADNESDFINLRKRKRCWKKVEMEFKSQKAGMDLTLREELIQMGEDDQKYRIKIQELAQTEDKNFTSINELRRKQSVIDSKNLTRCEEIIAKNGYPSKKIVGKKAAISIFRVIQHAALSYQQKYIPLFQEAVVNGDLEMKTFALMIDRIEVRKGRPQIYGTQIRTNTKTGELSFDKIVDEKKINKRRIFIGLPSIESYAKQINIEYKYKKQKYTSSDFNKFSGGWDLVNIRDAETFEINFLPKQKFWVEFLAKGRLRFNRTVNICEMKYQATDIGRLVFTPNLDCTENCCDDIEISRTLNYHNVIEFELYNNLLFLIDTKGRLWEFKRKKYKKRRMMQEEN